MTFSISIAGHASASYENDAQWAVVTTAEHAALEAALAKLAAELKAAGLTISTWSCSGPAGSIAQPSASVEVKAEADIDIL